MKESFITAGEAMLHLADSGKGEKCVVLLHGYLESMYVWDDFLPLLTPKMRVIAVDIPGHGLSDTIAEKHTMELMADVVRDMLDAKGILAAGREMYREMSPETAAFIDMMFDSEAFDVLSREGKWTGGYMTAFPLYKQPFIFANFNGTTADIDVITHEAGHAFAYFAGVNDMTPELDLGGMETAETHSMSMEFFAWPYMAKFFGEDERRYRYMHLFAALSFIPYGTIVDYFQEEVYTHPEMTPAERNDLWRRLESEFRPWLSTDGITYLEEGTRWQYQNHIYASPFYYIDYCLAQTVAIGFLELLPKDYDAAFATYLAHASRTGNSTFTELLSLAGLKSPFEEGALSELAATCERLLEDLK
jgi:M3 family oligoendopeptidase